MGHSYFNLTIVIPGLQKFAGLQKLTHLTHNVWILLCLLYKIMQQTASHSSANLLEFWKRYVQKSELRD